MNTATKRTIFTVNNTEFDSKYIGFTGDWGYGKCCKGHDLVNMGARTFVYIWQKSNDINDFQVNANAIFNRWNLETEQASNKRADELDPDSEYYNWIVQRLRNKKHTLQMTENSIKARARRYRAKGVKLKEFPAYTSQTDWNNLASFAETI